MKECIGIKSFFNFIETMDRLRVQVSEKNLDIKINYTFVGNVRTIIEVESSNLLVEGI